MRDMLIRHHVTLYGPTGDNGLVGNQKKLKADVRELRIMLATFLTVLRTLKWVALALGVMAATFKPDTLADLIRLLAAIAKLSG